MRYIEFEYGINQKSAKITRFFIWTGDDVLDSILFRFNNKNDRSGRYYPKDNGRLFLSGEFGALEMSMRSGPLVNINEHPLFAGKATHTTRDRQF